MFCRNFDVLGENIINVYLLCCWSIFHQSSSSRKFVQEVHLICYASVNKWHSTIPMLSLFLTFEHNTIIINNKCFLFFLLMLVKRTNFMKKSFTFNNIYKVLWMYCWANNSNQNNSHLNWSYVRIVYYHNSPALDNNFLPLEMRWRQIDYRVSLAAVFIFIQAFGATFNR